MVVSDREAKPRDPFHSPNHGGGADDVLTFRPRDPQEPDTEEDRPYDPPTIVPNDTSTSFRDLEAAPEEGEAGEYDLDAEPEPLPPPAPIPMHKTPSPARVVREDDSPDRPCRNCGYNLFGLPTEGNCPECGEPIAASRKTHLIRDANPAWSRKVSLGAKLILTGVIGRFAAGFVLGIMTIGSLSPASQIIGAVVGLAGAAVIFVGVWFLTIADPSGRGENSYGKIRQAARIGLCIGMLSNLIGTAEAVGLIPSGMVIASVTAVLVSELIWVVGTFCLLKYIEKLAARIPSPHLQDRSELVFWGFGLSAGAMAILVFVTFLAQLASPMGGAAMGCMAVLAMIVVGIAFIVFAVMYLLLLGGLASEFDLARKEGEKQAAMLRKRTLSGPPKQRPRAIEPGPAGPPSAMRL